MSVSRRIKQSKAFESLANEAIIGLQVAAAYWEQRLGEVFARHGVTSDQYNVLRILRGVHPDGHPRYEIADRLIHRAPDVTRLLDRLERQGLVKRVRSNEDRRLSITCITDAGLRLLDEIDPDRLAVQNEIADRLSESDLRELSRIADALVP
jgi:DNA-binding MarR family transcriptional regulator